MKFRSVVLLCLYLFTQASAGSVDDLKEYVGSKTQFMLVPQTDSSKPVVVDYQMGVLDIEDVDRRRGELTIRSWFSVIWNSTITWNPEDYGGSSYVYLPAFDGFVPLIVSYQSAGHHSFLLKPVTRYTSEGFTEFYMELRWKLLCDLSEEDSCAVKVISSSYPNDVIHLRDPSKHHVDLNKMLAPYRFKKSNYRMTSESYSSGFVNFEGTDYDWVEYKFSFSKRRSAVGGSPMEVLKWY